MNLLTRELTTTLRLLFGAIAAVLLLSCSHLRPGPGGFDRTAPSPAPVAEPVTPAAAAPAAGETVPVIPGQELTADMMHDILLGEIAGQRGALDVSVDHYLQAMAAASDPRVAERAVQIASYAHKYSQALQAARRWAALDPHNAEARKTLMVLALQNGDLDEVVTQMDHMLQQSPDPQETFRMVTAVLARHQDRDAAVNAVRRLVNRYPENPHAWMSLARLAFVAKQVDVALEAVGHALAMQPDMTDAIILKAQALISAARKPEALELIRAANRQYPRDTGLMFTYGRMLVDADQIEAAKSQFARVVRQEPDNADGLYSLALLELETGDYAGSEKHLRRLLKLKEREQNVRYYLGYAAQGQKRNDEALEWYSQVESGDFWRQAQLRIALIHVDRGDIDGMRDYMRMLRQKNPEQVVDIYLIEGQVLTDAGMHREAYDLYGRALQFSPENGDLLYSHSLAAEKLGKLDIAESNLRRILARDPDDVRSLNALGYTLADRTDRYSEALQYISRAYEHEPNDPAIIDSMGWVHFRLGEFDQALAYLQRAWELSGDSEIGAHLGEVLWTLGQRDEARRIWDISRKAMPDNPVLLEVLERLAP